jgi:hypothetical protein
MTILISYLLDLLLDLKMEAVYYSRMPVNFYHILYAVTSQKTALFAVTAVGT